MNMSTALLQAIERDKRSQPALAEAAGIDKAALYRFIVGERSLRLPSADRLCEAMGLECRLVKRRRRGGVR
jgi:hypothetical protein